MKSIKYNLKKMLPIILNFTIKNWFKVIISVCAIYFTVMVSDAFDNEGRIKISPVNVDASISGNVNADVDGQIDTY